MSALKRPFGLSMMLPKLKANKMEAAGHGDENTAPTPQAPRGGSAAATPVKPAQQAGGKPQAEAPAGGAPILAASATSAGLRRRGSFVAVAGPLVAFPTTAPDDSGARRRQGP